mmetsp:Transcript_3290/g.5685  ORF Transcript_3290/g.5685 Transcript_3290/m.5685 type:complete len:181 (+) Transcript_3290:150-692(+)
MIDPGTAPSGETVSDYCRRRWGGAGWTNHLKSEGRKDGARFSDWKWWPNTSKAHQLVNYVDKNNICSTDRVNALLFEAEYERGENISLVDVLVEVGQRAGVENVEDLRAYLTNDDGNSEVQREIMQGRRRYQISGVPFFIVSGPPKSDGSISRPYGFSGAQASDTFVEVFEELAADNNTN